MKSKSRSKSIIKSKSRSTKSNMSANALSEEEMYEAVSRIVDPTTFKAQFKKTLTQLSKLDSEPRYDYRLWKNDKAKLMKNKNKYQVYVTTVFNTEKDFGNFEYKEWLKEDAAERLSGRESVTLTVLVETMVDAALNNGSYVRSKVMAKVLFIFFVWLNRK